MKTILLFITLFIVTLSCGGSKFNNQYIQIEEMAFPFISKVVYYDMNGVRDGEWLYFHKEWSDLVEVFHLDTTQTYQLVIDKKNSVGILIYK